MPRRPLKHRRNHNIMLPRGTDPPTPSKQSGGSAVTATQLMLITTLIGSISILLNLYHLFPKNTSVDATLESAAQIITTTRHTQKNDHLAKIRSQRPPVHPEDQGRKLHSVDYHIIFSTGCSAKQNFQSYVFYYHAMKSGQPGEVTRIAACNDDEESKALREYHKQFIQPMSRNFHLHITPDYSNIKPGVKKFHYFNKPFSTHHWMENQLGYVPEHTKIGDNVHDNTIIVLCDPDQIIMRPFTNNQFFNETELWLKKSVFPILTYVDHGKPMGQFYGFYDQWKTKTNITRYVPGEELPSHVQTMSKAEKDAHYAVGPPYIATAHDFYKIVSKWKEFVPLVHDDYPHLLAEMFAYCLAAAHLRLPHQIAKSFMVSDVGSGDLEGWKLLDKYSKRDVCTKGAISKDDLPHILHYCQRYTLGKYVLGKHRMSDTNFLSCEHPLLGEPPEDLGEKYNFYINPDNKKKDEKMKLGSFVIKQHAFMLCHLIPYLNQVASYWKDQHCKEKPVNKEKTHVFFDNMEVDEKFFEQN